MIFVSSQKALSTEIKTVIKQQLENASNGWTAYRIARQASRMVSENTWRKMVCCDWRNARVFLELDKRIREIVGLGRRKWMGGKKVKITFSPDFFLIPRNADSDIYHLGHSSHQNVFFSLVLLKHLRRKWVMSWHFLEHIPNLYCLTALLNVMYGSLSSMWKKEEKYTVPLSPSVNSQLGLELHRNPSMRCCGKFP